MLSKNKIKLIKSLEQKKFRLKHNCFIIEGEKMIQELLVSKFKIIELFHTPEFNITHQDIDNTIISEQELKKISLLKTANKALAIVELPKATKYNTINGLNLVLDNVQDPGNLGTIIRTANWFGIKRIFCSTETADLYNPKVVQSTMGALFRTNVYYCNVEQLINTAKLQNIPIYGTLLSGSNIYEQNLSNTGLIVLGNESKGISPKIEKLVDHKIKIPNYSTDSEFMESLNVGVANAIVLAEFKRQLSQ